MGVSRRALFALAAAAALPAWAARAQDFPSRPVTIIAAGAAGGPTDTITRILADSMGRHLSQPVVVEAVGPANVATQRLAQSKPDGYTLMVTSATLFRHLPYDIPGSFAPLGLVSDAAMTLVARPDWCRRGKCWKWLTA